MRIRKMVRAVAFLKNYFDTYDKQLGYENYKDRILIDDTLYGLGVAIGGDKYKFANGYAKFKEVLRKHLDK